MRGAEGSDQFPELQVGGDDDAGFLVELADQVEQQCTAGFRERDIAQFVDDDAIQSRQLPDDLPGIGIGRLLNWSEFDVTWERCTGGLTCALRARVQAASYFSCLISASERCAGDSR